MSAGMLLFKKMNMYTIRQNYVHHLMSIDLLFLLINIIAHAQALDCRNPINLSGSCINIRQCPTLVNLLMKYGHRMKVGDFLRSSVCGYDELDPQVCCAYNIYTNINATDTYKKNIHTRLRGSTISSPIPTTRNGPLFFPKCGMEPMRGKTIFEIEAKEQFYLRNEQYPNNLVRGEKSDLLYGWMALIGYNTSKNTPSWSCGGSLISSRHVLTAAHCVYEQRHLYVVRLGEVDLDPYVEDGATPVDIGIDKSHIHPNYNDSTFVNDIAVLRLKKDVQFTRRIRPICLPIGDDFWYNNEFTDKKVDIAGWGALTWQGQSASHLQVATIEIQNNSRCENGFASKRTASSQPVIIDDRIICAGDGVKDICSGDSGGPLMLSVNKYWFDNPNAWYAVGISSFGFQCGSGTPSAYTNVTSFLEFILPLLI